jgi:hypothetical protein
LIKKISVGEDPGVALEETNRRRQESCKYDFNSGVSCLERSWVVFQTNFSGSMNFCLVVVAQERLHEKDKIPITMNRVSPSQ